MSKSDYFHPEVSQISMPFMHNSAQSLDRSKKGFIVALNSLMSSHHGVTDGTVCVPALAAPATSGTSAASDFSSTTLVKESPASQPHTYPCTSTSNGSSHVCRVCAKTFRASSLLDIHMRVHVGAKPFACPTCGHRATQKGNLKLHMKKHHGADLPPHIDLVPDSGIWGHPQADFVIASGLVSGIDNCKDPSGKRKQVAQAVSSLFNEEVVDLIKKYQNDVGQASPGTITESLDDFLRIARSKKNQEILAELGSCLDQKEKFLKQQDGKTYALSVRFQPYSVNNDKKSGVQSKAVCLKPSLPTCKVCGEQYSKINKIFMKKQHSSDIDGLSLCDVCYSHPARRNVLTPSSLVGASSCSSKQLDYSASNKFSHCSDLWCGDDTLSSRKRRPVGTSSDEWNLHKSHKFSMKYGACFSEKNEFLSLLKLTPKMRKKTAQMLESRFDKGINQISNTPLTFDEMQTTNQTKIKAKSQSTEMQMSNAYESEQGIKNRASYDVLDLLRKTLLESRAICKPALPGYSEEVGMTESLAHETLSYRNPAMKSLATIGQTLPRNIEDTTVDSVKYGQFYPNNESMACDGSFQCRYCLKKFKYRSVLEIHLRSHTGERPYKCSYCDYAGTQQNCLKLHIQRHHPDRCLDQDSEYQNNDKESKQTSNMSTGTCPVSCPVCGRTSPSLGYLKIHMRSHKKRLDHICRICGRGFKEYWYLSTHLKTHERELDIFNIDYQQYKNFRLQEAQPVQNPATSRSGQHEVSPPLNLRENSNFNFPQMHSQSELQAKSSSLSIQRSSNSPSCGSDAINSTPLSKYTSSRMRRRKPLCPSRIILSTTPALGTAASSEYVNEIPAETLEKEQSDHLHLGDTSGESPLDLRCATRKNIHV